MPDRDDRLHEAMEGAPGGMHRPGWSDPYKRRKKRSHLPGRGTNRDQEVIGCHRACIRKQTRMERDVWLRILDAALLACALAGCAVVAIAMRMIINGT